MPNLIDRIQRALRRSTRKAQAMPLSAAQVKTMMGQVGKTLAVEYACDEVQQLLDQFAERVLQGENGASWMALVRRHLELCPDCREEFEALLRILKAKAA